ncbi:toprim domain-containing protein [Inconstantimicrobium porci]|uniref:toprim domain-containing protein n=1 Tax=Inconstantimicrobium porci TaxID=2652291 RepID=UPI002409AEE1|nr:toprim domain-containing protein [Inconstantimicrobium porci]MDD6769709.1 toprim domain-containing protein [Inconstantimicrobium porci]
MIAVELIKSKLNKDVVMQLLKDNGAKNITVSDNEIRSTCPLHGGDNPTAFCWNLTTNTWNCYTRCGFGDFFTFIAIKEELDISKDFKKVASICASIVGVNINNFDESTEEYEYSKMLNIMKRHLRNVKVNMKYDIKLLGSKFPLNKYKQFDKATLCNNAFYFKDMNRIGFIIRDIDDVVIGCSLRAMDEVTKPKWLHRPASIQTGETFYNIHDVVGKYKTVYIVEGITDTLNMINIGIPNVIGAFGARITFSQRLLLAKYFDEIILMFDNDEAGQKAIDKAIKFCNRVINVCYAEYDTKDPGLLKNKDNIVIKHWTERRNFK